MGLETVDPAVLPRLNKRMSLGDFERATSLLLSAEIDVRAFTLLRTPFQSEWDIEKFFDCIDCGPKRAERIREINLSQATVPHINCGCGR